MLLFFLNCSTYLVHPSTCDYSHSWWCRQKPDTWGEWPPCIPPNWKKNSEGKMAVTEGGNVRLETECGQMDWDVWVGAVIFDWAQKFSLPEELQYQIDTVIVMHFFQFNCVFIVWKRIWHFYFLIWLGCFPGRGRIWLGCFPGRGRIWLGCFPGRGRIWLGFVPGRSWIWLGFVPGRGWIRHGYLTEIYFGQCQDYRWFVRGRVTIWLGGLSGCGRIWLGGLFGRGPIWLGVLIGRGSKDCI